MKIRFAIDFRLRIVRQRLRRCVEFVNLKKSVSGEAAGTTRVNAISVGGPLRHRRYESKFAPVSYDLRGILNKARPLCSIRYNFNWSSQV